MVIWSSCQVWYGGLVIVSGLLWWFGHCARLGGWYGGLVTVSDLV